MEKTPIHSADNADSGNNVVFGEDQRASSRSSSEFQDRRRRVRGSRHRSHTTRPTKAAPPLWFDRAGLELAVEEWIGDGKIALNSPRTEELRRAVFLRLYRHLDDTEAQWCDNTAIRAFFSDPRHQRTGKPISVEYNETLRRLFKIFWKRALERDLVRANPMDDLPPIKGSKRQKDDRQIFSPEQIDAIEGAARKGRQPKRDLALLYFAHDTGLRASELADLLFRDLNLDSMMARFIGKGEKERTVFWSGTTHTALWNYWREQGVNPLHEPDEPLFVAANGPNIGCQMTRYGISAAIRRLCKTAGITDGKMGIHRLRHTAATDMIRNGAYQDTVQAMLGHSDPKMTQIYVTMAKADLQRQHAKFSPVATRKKKRK